jgi:hypothetical protein
MNKSEGSNDTTHFRQRSATQTWAPNAELFVQRVGLTPFPGAYANRGATTADLDPKTLKVIHGHIATHVGAEAASNFRKMVEDIPYLSAEAFLTMLYSLEVAAWRWDRSSLLAHREFSSKARVSSGPTNTGFLRDETEYIKRQFKKLLDSEDEGIKLEQYTW